MQINMASADALRQMEHGYAGGSKPISINSRPAQAQSVQWWTSSVRNETIGHDRKRAALRVYLQIAAQSVENVPPDTFPAAFLFNDNARYRPDKGLVKALLQAGAISDTIFADELCFVLTDKGRQLL